MWLVLGVYVAGTTGGSIWWHFQQHSVVNPFQAALAFFLPLNVVVCLWEICLFAEIDLIEKKHTLYSAQVNRVIRREMYGACSNCGERLHSKP